jgi:hypothetical protein
MALSMLKIIILGCRVGLSLTVIGVAVSLGVIVVLTVFMSEVFLKCKTILSFLTFTEETFPP